MNPSAGLLLDTCAAIWLSTSRPMSPASLRQIRARQDDRSIFVSPFTAWEVAMLVARGRLRLAITTEAWFSSLLALPGLRLALMPPEVLIASAALPGAPPRDPADRIIAATARAYDLTVVTRYRELLPYAAAGHIAAIRC